MEMQTDLVSLWADEKKLQSPDMKRKLSQTKSNISMRLANYGKDIVDEF